VPLPSVVGSISQSVSRVVSLSPKLQVSGVTALAPTLVTDDESLGNLPVSQLPRHTVGFLRPNLPPYLSIPAVVFTRSPRPTLVGTSAVYFAPESVLHSLRPLCPTTIHFTLCKERFRPRTDGGRRLSWFAGTDSLPTRATAPRPLPRSGPSSPRPPDAETDTALASFGLLSWCSRRREPHSLADLQS